MLDASTPALNILQTIQEKQRRTPTIPLGSRGVFGGTQYEAAGFQTRAVEVEGVTYEWSEYVLFNPYKGYIYLSEYDGHWNVIRTIHAVPEVRVKGRPVLTYEGRQYRHFQHSAAETIFILGEFPWRARAGEKVALDDYISPPYVLSSERTGQEVTWSHGEYATGKQIWQAFKLPGRPPSARGAYLNQPNPDTGKAAEAWRIYGVFMLALIALACIFFLISQRQPVLNERHHFYPGQAGEQAFVTPIFEIKGHESNVEIKTNTDLDNNWFYINYALINADTGAAYDFGREISYYRSGGESEGDRTDSVRIPAVPSGRYYLRVEPEGEAKNPPVEYDILVRRDVPSVLYFVLAAILLTIPPIMTGWHTYRFEMRRWQESDYSKSGGG